MLERHPGVGMANVLKEAVEKWGIPPNPPLVTDKASKMILTAGEFGSVNVGCLAHTLNLTCGKALQISSVSNLLAQIRQGVGYFHRSCVVMTVLREKHTLLQLAQHKLVRDVPTRWNSALDMVTRYLEEHKWWKV